MPDAKGNLKPISVPADAWERVFGKCPCGKPRKDCGCKGDCENCRCRDGA